LQNLDQPEKNLREKCHIYLPRNQRRSKRFNALDTSHQQDLQTRRNLWSGYFQQGEARL